MTIKELVKTIVTREGKLSQVKIGDVREIVGIISDIFYEREEEGDSEILILAEMLFKNGKRRSKKRSK